jgi:hypothetical protein
LRLAHVSAQATGADVNGHRYTPKDIWTHQILDVSPIACVVAVLVSSTVHFNSNSPQSKAIILSTFEMRN